VQFKLPEKVDQFVFPIGDIIRHSMAGL